jgi:choline dehydrogenase
MVYVRGQAEDYDRWHELGNRGWSYAEVLPYFKRSEDNENGANQFHGSGGPLWVGNVVNEFPICEDFIQAAHQAGHPINTDSNSHTQEGVGYFAHNIKNGRRFSSASAFLRAGRKLPKLTIATDAVVQRLCFDGKKVTGINCSIKGKTVSIKANREIVLSCGAINSPKLLELSGIGHRDQLTAHNIEIVHHLPGVGENLHDHWNGYVKRSVDKGSTFFSEAKPLRMIRNLFRYLFFRRSFLSLPAALVAVYYKSQEHSTRADAQIHFSPAASSYDEQGNMVPIDGITIASCGTRPSSRGSSHIGSNNASDKPVIKVNYLDTEYDQQLAIAAFKKMRSILDQEALKSYGGHELAPGTSVQSDSEILDYIRATGDPVHHLAGTCKMGNDELAVVDEQLRVQGIEGLRVADASIMPEIVSGNTHAACVMIGEKAADLILAQQ